MPATLTVSTALLINFNPNQSINQSESTNQSIRINQSINFKSKKPRCYNCEAPGHVVSDQDLDPLCGVCLNADHHTSDCPFLILSVNVEPVACPLPSYAEVTRQNGNAKRKADREQSRSTSPEQSRDENPDGRGKIRRREKESLRDR